MPNKTLPSTTDSSDSTSEPEFEPSSSTVRRIENKKGNQIVSLDSMAMMADKMGVSDRSAATLASVVLE